MESFTWTISDPSLIKAIKTAKPNQTFVSTTFRLFNFTFELELWPNGDEDAKGNVSVYLNICGFSPNVQSIKIKRKYMFLEVDTTCESNCTITADKMYCDAWSEGYVKTKDIQKLNQLTFKVDVTLYNVFDKNNNDITDKYVNIEHTTGDIQFSHGSYTWKIRDAAFIIQMKTAKKGQQFISPPFRLFNMTFELRLEPKKTNSTTGDTQWVAIFLYLCGMPPNVNSMNIKMKYQLMECGAIKEHCRTITPEKMYCSSWIVKTVNIQKLKEMTFKVDGTLNNVFDKNDNDITDKYLYSESSDSGQTNIRKRDLTEANINIIPTKKRRKYSIDNNNNNSNNNSNNNRNIDELIEAKIDEMNELSNALSELQKEKQKQTKEFKQMYEKEKKENDSLNKINLLINDQCNTLQNSNEKIQKELKDSHKQIETLRKENKALHEKINIYNGTSESIKKNRLDLEQLNKFEKELMKGMQCISKSRGTLMELQNKCIVCRENDKNMVFMDGCTHVVLCMECENKLETKQCPMCRTPYTNARKVNL